MDVTGKSVCSLYKVPQTYDDWMMERESIRLFTFEGQCFSEWTILVENYLVAYNLHGMIID